MQMPVVLDTLRMRKAKNSAIRRRLASRNRWNLQQARSRRFAVFSPKRAQRRSVSHSRSRRCLDFDGQEAATGLDYKIHLLAGCRSPIQNFRRLGPSITPAHEILEYDVFEVRAARFGNAG